MEKIVWTTEMRYQPVEALSAERIDQLTQSTQNDPFYPTFHIAPKHGLLNDPNGLCHYNGEHHIFYQWCGLGAVHGLKYWYHVSTKDFINYKDLGIGIAPMDDYDSHGVYSGSALVDNGEVDLFFTGNKRDEHWVRVPSQCLAVMKADGSIEKKGVVVPNEHYTEHFRDPKVWKQDNDYLMVVGAQTPALKGQAALYKSADKLNWQHLGVIKTQYTDFGYMWECPDLFELDGKTVLLFSPQGVKDGSKYQFSNIFHVGYILADRLDVDNVELINPQPIVELDSGFDFYAPQTYVDDKGRRIVFGWIGLPDIDYPTDVNQWAHMLSIPRQLRVKNNRLIQQPLPELEVLRAESLFVSGEVALKSRSFELELLTDVDNFAITFSNAAGDEAVLRFNHDEIELDRSNMTHGFAKEYGTSRYVQRRHQQQYVRVFFDNSVIEVFINNGENTLTGRIFIDELSRLHISGGLEGQLHYLRAMQYN